METIHKERLLELASFLDIVPPEKFDFKVVIKGPDVPRRQLDCGSVACAIGYLPAVFPELVTTEAHARGFSVIPSDPAWKRQYGWSVSLHVQTAKHIFGTTTEESHYLFTPDPDDGYANIQLLPATATAQQVAERIRSFVAAKEQGINPLNPGAPVQ